MWVIAGQEDYPLAHDVELGSRRMRPKLNRVQFESGRLSGGLDGAAIAPI